MKAFQKIALLLAVIGLNFTVACTNVTQGTSSNTAGSTSTGVNANVTSTTYSHTLKAFAYSAASSSTASSATLTETLTADTSSANYQPLTGFCGISTNPCQCEMVWTQSTTVNGGTSSYTRTKRVAVTEVQTGLVKCVLDETTWNEIPDATVISFRIIPGALNVTGLNTSTLHWKKGTSVSASGDFLDDTLTPFRNIHCYSCYTKSTGARAYEIVNNFTTASASGASASSSTGSTSYPFFMGSQYCIGSALGTSTSTSSGASTSTSCPTPRSGFTAQSYYRNFYIQSDQVGNINSTNDTYECPKVLESIKYSAGQAIPSSEQGKYYPLDTTFSLATVPTSDWSVGVPAASNIFKDGDANSAQTLCQDESVTTTNADGTTTTTTSSNRLKDGKTVIKCIGYGKKPNTDGTCGTIKDSNGRVRQLTRLRRFRTMYPPMFDATGKVFTTSPFADEVYVADRLVVDNTGTATGNMIYGPKPCNFAWFDHEGVTKRDGTTDFKSNLVGDSNALGTPWYATPGYRATSDYQYVQDRDQDPALDPNVGLHKWSVDPDGLVIPNIDRSGSTTNAQNYGSCSVSLPWVDWSNGTSGSATDLRLITTNSSRADHVTLGSRTIFLKEIANQTVDPFTPNYVEDTSFSACVPLPTTFVEPPLHFYRKTDNSIAWCTESYPTQNPYWYALNQQRKPQSGSASLTANIVNYPTSALSGGTALVKNYTSHDTGLSTASTSLDADYNGNCSGTPVSTICSMTGFANTSFDATYAYCAAFLARNASSRACDRTVMFDSTEQFTGLPLLAADKDIDTMLKSDLEHDANFACTYSVNSDPSKVGTKIPGSGCCGVVGANPQKLLRDLVNGGHLEPYKDPTAIDDIRFCGWPVQ